MSSAQLKCFLALCACAALLVLPPAPAGAQTASSSYGPWDPAQTPDTFRVFSDEVSAFNSNEVAEQTSFACTFADGSTLSRRQRELLSELFRQAAAVYGGSLEAIGSAPGIRRGGPKNAGYATGKSGMQAFLRHEKALLSAGLWSDYSKRQLERAAGRRPAGTYLTQAPGWQIASKGTSPLDGTSQRKLADLIPTDAEHPLELTSLLPEACALDAIDQPEPKLGTLFDNSGRFVLDTLLYIPATLAEAGHDYLQPQAFRYAFWTPHTERGDLMWSVPTSCSPRAPENKAFSATEIRASCRGEEPLGFSGQAGSEQRGTAWFLAAAQSVQWLLTGVYLLIFLGAALVYMLRGSPGMIGSVMRLVPRLLLSIVLVISAGWLIGAGVSASNLAVDFIFGFDDAPTVGALNTFMLQAGQIAGGSEIFQQLVSLTVGTFSIFFYAVFFLSAITRQVVLVALIILAPLAALCLIVERWRHHFSTYVRALAAVLLLPVVLALILRIGTSINPLILNPAAAYGGLEGLFGLGLMLLTLYFMYKAIRLTGAYAISGRLVAAADGAAGGMHAAGLHGLLDRLRGRGLQEQTKAALVSPERAVLSTQPQAAPAALVDASRARGGQDRGGAPLPEERPALKALSAGPRRPREDEGMRISAEAARDYRLGMRREVENEVKRLGRRLSRVEFEQLQEKYKRQHGELKEKAGAWYLLRAQAAEEGRRRAARKESEEALRRMSGN